MKYAIYADRSDSQPLAIFSSEVWAKEWRDKYCATAEMQVMHDDYFDIKANLSAEIVRLKEDVEVEKIKAGIFFHALERAGAPLADAYPHKLYAWADNVKQNKE